MNGVILYMGKHGSTKQYADWISEETGFAAIDLKKESKPVLEDMVIIGSWILAGRLVAHGWIKKNWSKIEDKKVIVFSVGADEPDEKLREKYMGSSLPEGARDKVAFYALQGRFRREDQNFMLRKMLNFAVRFEKDGDLANNMVMGVNGVKRENLEEMLRYVRSFER